MFKEVYLTCACGPQAQYEKEIRLSRYTRGLGLVAALGVITASTLLFTLPGMSNVCATVGEIGAPIGLIGLALAVSIRCIKGQRRASGSPPRALCQTNTLSVIFSFLKPSELATCARVCKTWNQAQNTEELWKTFCLNQLENPKPFRNSWKKRYKIICTWLHSRHVQPEMWSAPKFSHTAHSFTFLADETAVEVYRKFNNVTNYEVRTVSTRQVREIDTGSIQNVRIIATDLNEADWCGLNAIGQFFWFDVRNAQHLGTFVTENHPQESDEGKIRITNRECVVSFNQHITVWNLDTHTRLFKMDATHVDPIRQLYATPHFVICQVHPPNMYWTDLTVALKKGTSDTITLCDPRRTPILRAQRLTDTKAFGSYVAVSCVWTVEIWQDDGTQLNSIFRWQSETFFETPAIETIGLYHNWLFVKDFGRIAIVNFKRKPQAFKEKEIRIQRFSSMQQELCMNGNKLWLRMLEGNGWFASSGFHNVMFDFSAERVSPKSHFKQFLNWLAE